MRFPIVLVHGMAASDRWPLVRFWGRIPDRLRAQGWEVFLGDTDAWGTYQTNALRQKTRLDGILAKTGAEKVNLVAHSKGGIDCRYLIGELGYGNRVASLVTVNTPHRGTRLADALVAHLPLGQSLRRSLTAFAKVYRDKSPDPYKALIQMTTDHMAGFNAAYPPDEGVHYQAVFSRLSRPWDDLLLASSHAVLRRTSGPNDGIVPCDSAAWGEDPIQIPGSLSHFAMMDLYSRRVSGVDVPGVYVDIARGLEARGF